MSISNMSGINKIKSAGVTAEQWQAEGLGDEASFKAADTDKSGNITARELITAAEKNRAIIDAGDTDGNGKLSSDEAAALLKKMQVHGLNAEQFKSAGIGDKDAFKAADADGNGLIDVDELGAALAKGKAKAEALKAAKSDADSDVTEPPAPAHTLNEDQWADAKTGVKVSDVDGIFGAEKDGLISEAELREALKSNDKLKKIADTDGNGTLSRAEADTFVHKLLKSLPTGNIKAA